MKKFLLTLIVVGLIIVNFLALLNMQTINDKMEIISQDIQKGIIAFDCLNSGECAYRIVIAYGQQLQNAQSEEAKVE